MSKLAERIKSHPRVWALDGRAEGFADWFVELNAGWKWSGDPLLPCHSFGAETLTEAMEGVRNALPCDCEQCK